MSTVQIRFFLISSGAAVSFLRLRLAHIFDFSLTFFVSSSAGQISFFWSRLLGATSDSACDSLRPSAQGQVFPYCRAVLCSSRDSLLKSLFFLAGEH
jgi:hypothetical protein